MDESHHHGHAASHHVVFDSPGMAADAELEGEILIGLMAEGATALAGLCDRHGLDVRRVLDIGCGPGVGTCCLAEEFGSARVVAVDGSATMLERVKARSQRLGLAERVETRQAELPGGLADLDGADVVWASMVIHHVGDEAAALGGIRGLLTPGGLLAVVEVADPLRFLPPEADLGRPGIWERLDAAWAAWFTGMRAELPETVPSAGYPAMFEQAGFELLVDEVLTLVIGAPLDERARRFAHGRVQRMQHQLEAHADAADLAALDGLLDEDADEGIMRRDDVLIRGTRHLYIARTRPES